MINDTRSYVESETPLEDHKYTGWFWHEDTRKFYRWNDLMELFKHDYFDTDLSSTKRMETEHGNS